MRDILIVYYSRTFPIQATILDHLYSLKQYSGERCWYLNLALPVPGYFKRRRFDAIVFHTIMLVERFHPAQFASIRRSAAFLAGAPGVKIAVPQDEHVYGEALNGFIDEFGVDVVLSCAQPSEWPKLYPDVDRERVRFETVLPGYLSDETLARIDALSRVERERDIDVGYRAWKPWPSLGSHGMLKLDVGRVVAEKAPAHGLVTDISNDPADTFLGEKWFEFLLRCKYTLGVEGGASVRDWDGSVRACTERCLGEDAAATLGEIEAACFPGRDGEIDYAAISPRHLEACATRTCQVLVEGTYSGILKPGEHYIELKRDFSDADEVLETLKRDELRAAIVERAYRDVVASGEWTYRKLVAQVLAYVPEPGTARTGGLEYARARLRDALTWRLWGAGWRVRHALERLVGRERIGAAWRGVKRRMGEA